ncbi:transcriptional regulator [Streptomyces sp. NWU339]|uniref:helix-turn-helix domain-containing protein n=1 Tax=Streptomyces sp. NWU339 TaxID=2185284 RepID=UPI000D68392A|nr:helix-turn-helix transcriptional regulator [Streptomyces sp. NWU339]PWI09934.1 transcriptional regulator [Streptomyces sp. NWU339]
MSAQDDVARFAALLRELKERTDRSYGSLARRLGMNTSTLHRYCAGEAVPLDFAPVERFAALCGASGGERLELHRRWLLAVAARQRPRAAEAEAPGGDGDAAVAGTGTDTGTERPAPDAGTVSGPRPAPARPRPWYRRKRVAGTLAVACASLATVGTLAALPDGHRSSPDDGTRAATANPAPTASAEPTAADRPAPSPPASGSPGSSGSSVSGRTPGAPGARGEPSGPAAPGGAGRTPEKSAAPAGAPLAWTVDSHAWAFGCGHDYVIAKPPAEVPPPPAPQDAGTWAATQTAVHGGETIVELSVQGTSDTAVVLTALRVRVTGRTDPAPGNAYAMDQGCGGALTPRYFDVDLDKDRPVARAVAGNDAGTPIPAVRMPYRVSATDPEVLQVTARTVTCDCSWYLELDWSFTGRSGTVRIDDRGRPFRTSGIEGLPRYEYDTGARRWAPRMG